jgi:hypothetical protein
MATIKELFGTAAQAITITLDALANTSATVGRQSTAVDNTVNLYTDALVQLTLVSASASVSTTGTVEVYAYGSVDGGASYDDGVTGVDGASTLTSPANMVRIGTVNVVAASTTYKSRLMSVAVAFGGVLPAKWGIVVLNKSGAALGTGCAAQYQGMLLQAA